MNPYMTMLESPMFAAYEPMLLIDEPNTKKRSKRSGGADYKHKKSNRKYSIKAKLKRRRK